MGPRLRVEPGEFLEIVERERGLVIKGPKVVFSGTMYLTRSGDYYYYANSKEPLRMPEGVVVSEAKSILL